MSYMFPLTLKKSNQEILFQIDEISERGFDYSTFRTGNYFSLFWIKQGKGKYKLDSGEFEFKDNSILSFIPQQPFVLSTSESIKGTCIYFHSDFFPVEKLAGDFSEISLLNHFYSSVELKLNENLSNEFEFIEKRIISEMVNSGIAKYDLLLSYLKIFLLNAAREKAEQNENKKGPLVKAPEVLVLLQYYIEMNFRKSHSPAYYAQLLNKTPKYLNKLVKKVYEKTLTKVIQERIIAEAKRELLQSKKSIKAIGIELGFQDVFYFSRFFKKLTGLSPENFRNAGSIT